MSSDAPSYAADIKPFFRDKDRESMEFAFDLHSYEDVRDNAEAIYERLENGSMPCDGEWPEDRLALFREWIAAGMPA
jgi:hypothetical protein